MYSRLINRMKECSKLYQETRDDKYLKEDYCICHVMECKTLQTYEVIRNTAIKKGFNRVFDIGCALGHQSEVFLNSPVDYIGVNEDNEDFWNKDTFEYIVGQYPFEIKTKKEDLAISVLCLTWNCYLYEDDTLEKQCEALARDFNSCLLYVQKDMIKTVEKHFKTSEHIDENLMFFTN